ncbi:MAG: hypothetical protein CVV64_12410 [Candidatus Wallbacteria bacterium HGW-Wallbacteria-1]|jgi:peroxiredoxin|uniref:Thioredoxin domain-containing protein n=1 Tax=Candidatus Wallbacteria bacterium HGW-Wallbacteria-1 TaxID=2013854 RepID=A0A2N1PNB8_9BACT|nr:MAG: hypothetical protein CVV64_12410 [Candidatus Wallbacteria bacterium HGW-Wallbacteria-1]
MEGMSREVRGALFATVIPWLTRTCSSDSGPKATIPCLDITTAPGSSRGPFSDELQTRLIPSGGIAPDFTAMTLDGEEISLSQFRGRSNVVLLEWATWCETCAVEIPEISHFTEELAARGVTVLAVNFMEKPEVVREFADRHKLSMKVVMDTDRKIARSFRMTFIPVVVIIDKEGVVRHIGKGVPVTELLELLKPITHGDELLGK